MLSSLNYHPLSFPFPAPASYPSPYHNELVYFEPPITSLSSGHSYLRPFMPEEKASTSEDQQGPKQVAADSTMSSNSQADGSGNGQNTDEWAHISDPRERRRVQNRIAQRNYRVRKRTEQEEQARIAESQSVAGAAYMPPEPEDLARNDNPAGMPWGSYLYRHAIEASRARDAQSTATTREGSVAASSSAGGGGSGGGSTTGGGRRFDFYPSPFRYQGTSSLGLQLPRLWATSAPPLWRNWPPRRQ